MSAGYNPLSNPTERGGPPRYRQNHRVSSEVDTRHARRALESKHAEMAWLSDARERVHVNRSADEMDQLVSLQYVDVEAQTIDTVNRTRKAVEDALRRIQEGTYGVCEECGSRIHPKRLDAVPWAALCVRCQDIEDRRAA